MSRKSWDEHTEVADASRQGEAALRKRKIRRMGLLLGVWLFLAFTVPMALKSSGLLMAKVSHLTHQKLGPATGHGRRDGLASPQTYRGQASEENKRDSAKGTGKDSRQSK